MRRRYKRGKDYFVPRTTNTVCDVTGFKMKRSELRKRWDGFLVIPEAWHPRQPQDFAPHIQPQHIVKDARSVPDDPDPGDTSFEVI